MISFIIPTKNEDTVLEKTLACLARYSGEKEIIISDGRSTDKTIVIAKKYTDKIFIWAKEGRQTISNARNEGAKMAKGDLLVFLDADAIIPDPDTFFTELISLFETRPKLVALTVLIRVLPEMETFFDRIIMFWLNVTHMAANNWVHVGGAPGEFEMMRTSVFKQVNGFDETLIASEDEDMFHRLAKIGQTYFAWRSIVYHTGRRAHAIGWPKLLWQWFTNYLSMLLFRKAVSTEWKEIR